MNDQLSDDAFAARLREATAEVPPSHLDLDAVLASSRRKARRHRTAVGACCVFAAAVGTGVAVPNATTLLPDGRASAAFVVGPGTSSGGTAAATCDPADVEVTWRTESVRQIVARVERTAYDGASVATEELVAFDAQAGAPSVTGAGPLAPELEEGILREAAETEGSGVRFPERSAFFVPDEATDAAPRDQGPLEGFSGADGALASLHGFDSLVDPRPGTYLFYAAGDEHRASGFAACGEGGRRFELSYWLVDETGTIGCADPVDHAIAVYLKRAYCNVPLSDDERAVIGLDPDDPGSVAGVEAVSARLRIHAAAGE